MQYLITQIAVCLIIAALLGMIIGWWLKSIGCSRLIQQEKNRWKTKYDELKDKEREFSGQLEEQEKACQAKMERLKKERDEAQKKLDECEKTWKSRLNDLETEHNALTLKSKAQETNWKNMFAALESERDEAQAKLSDLDGSFKNERKRREALENRIEKLEAECVQLRKERDEAVEKVDKATATLKNSLTAIQLERDGLQVKLKDLEKNAQTQIEALKKKSEELRRRHESFKEKALRSETKVRKFIASFPDNNEEYDIEDVEGIGKKYAQRLRDMGITTSLALLKRCGDPKSRREISEKLQVEGAMMRNWVSRADLMRVKGIGGQYAELLTAAGIQSVRDLQRVNAIALAEKMKEINDEDHLFPGYYLPDAHAVTQWIEQAQKLDKIS